MDGGGIINEHRYGELSIKDFYTTSWCESICRFEILSFFDIAAPAISPTTTHMK
jgi:hypothetical protein